MVELKSFENEIQKIVKKKTQKNFWCHTKTLIN